MWPFTLYFNYNANLHKNVMWILFFADVFRIVATPFVEANTQTVKVKQVQDQLKRMETKAAESQTLEGTPRESPQPSPCPSPAPSESMLE